jgi:O-acetylhomoserine (thiol)-lyase
MAAITYAIMAITEAGDNIVSIPKLYGGTYNLFAHTLPRFGVAVRFAKDDKPDSIAALIDDKTKAVFCETIGNPSCIVSDLSSLADVAHQNGIPLMVDNTVATPYLCQPFAFGADVVVHSLTKYLGGHGTSVGGIIIDSGRFAWQDHKERFPMLSTPDPSYHGVTYTESFGDAAFVARARVVMLRNMGAALSPFNAFLFLQGIETLPLRMERHCSNALTVAQFLRKHPKVSWVNYPGLEDSPQKPLVDRYLGGKAAGILSFGIQGGRDAGARFIDALKLFVRLVNIGDAKSLACHPASTTHRQLSGQELEAAGVSEDMVRLSVGIEHPDDLLRDLEEALAAV